MTVAKQLTGMRGVYLVSAELSRLGFIASPTSRSAIGADILVTDQACMRTYAVQVKTNAKTFGFWLVGAKAKSYFSENHIYVLVNIRNKQSVETIDYYVIPSNVIAEKTKYSKSNTEKQTEWYQFNLPDALEYLNKWSIFDGAKTAA